MFDERGEIVLLLIFADLPFPANPPVCQWSSVHISHAPHASQ